MEYGEALFTIRPVERRRNMFQKILIANRGEIALRVICACKDLGIRTVAVYSEADRHSLHVRFADEAICIGPAKSARSYLDIPSVISAAEITNVDAIHPGYGFLSENADFAEVCETRGIKFIGPKPDVIRAMGLKQRARASDGRSRRADSARLEGRSARSPKRRSSLAGEIGYPVMLKASAGGGGRGMRIVRARRELPRTAGAGAGRSGGARFPAADVYMEKLVERPRHIEFQMLADKHGNVEILGERECSIQRRHQKLIEESPSPAVTPGAAQAHLRGLREAMRTIGYTNAGTVEFLMDETRQALLHRGERAHPGGASGHRNGHRHRSGEEPDPHRRRASRSTTSCLDAGRSCAATPSSAASTRSIRETFAPSPGRITGLNLPAASACAWTRRRTRTA